VLEAMEIELDVLRADGGAAANGFLMQLQADLARVPVEVAAEREATALGAASLAGLAVGTWPDLEALELVRPAAARYEPALGADEAERLLVEWRVAVRRTLL
jgi:glycerol kinase